MKWFYHLKISAKLLSAFFLVALIAGVVGIYGVINIQAIEGLDTELYEVNTVPLGEIGEMAVAFQKERVNLRDLIVERGSTDRNKYVTAENELSKTIDTNLETFKATIRSDEVRRIYDDLAANLKKFAPFKQQIISLCLANQEDQALTVLRGEAYAVSQAIDQGLTSLFDMKITQAGEKSDTNTKTANQAGVVMIILMAVAMVLAVILGVFISSIISKPVKEIEGVFGKMAEGNMQVNVTYESRDEIGNMASSIRKTNAMLSSYIQDIAHKLGLMSSGDMRINMDMDYIGDFAAIKTAIQNTALALNHTLRTINTAAEQVSTGAAQVAGGAQALAAGSTEQASSVEELSVSISKIAEQAAENSLSVKTATQYVGQAGQGVTASNEHMGQLSQAMAEIGTASNQITNITKVIEDIAFQTNILALNATIEAARAGNAGKGFAVVADEVRNLAAKSAEAAKQTADLIQASVTTVSKGTQLTEQTAHILHDVGEKAQLASQSIEKIDQASTEQAQAIEQIKVGLNQVSAVVQTNAATAEENSATSEEMSAQAATLREEVGKFRLDDGNEGDSFMAAARHKAPGKRTISLNETGSGFGKY